MTETLDSSKVISTLREEIELLENTCYEQRESIAILQSLLDASSRDQSKRITNSSDRNTVCAPSPPCANETPHLHDRALVIAEQRYEAAQRAHQATALEWRKQFGLLESERDAKAKRCLELEQALEEITQSQHSRDVDALYKELHHSRATIESTRLELDETLRLTLEQAAEIQEQSRVIRDLQMDLVELEGSLHQVQEERRIQDDVLQSLRKAAKDTPESEAQRLCVENQLLTERNLQLATLLAQKDLHSSTESLSTHMPEASPRAVSAAERPVPSQLEEEARTRNSIHSRLHALVSKIMKHPWDTNHKGTSTIPQSKIPLHSISSESSSSLQLIKVIEEYVIHLSERFSVYQHFASDVREERRSLCSLLLREEVKRMLDNFGASSTLLPSEITDASREGESDREFADNEQSRWLEAKRRIPILLLVLSGQRMDIERSRHTGVWGQDSDHLGSFSSSFASPLRSNTDRGTVSNRRDGVVALLQSTQRCLRALQTLYHGQSSTIRGGGIPNANVTTSQPSSIRIDRTLLFEMIELLNLLVHLMRNLLESTTASVQWAVNFQDAPRFTKKTTETTRSIHSSENRSPRQLPQYVDPNVNRGSPSGTSRSGKLHPVVIATRQRFEKRRGGDVAESTFVEPSHRSFVEKLSHFIHEESAAVDENHSPRMHAISRPPPSVSRKVFTNHSGK